MSVAAVGIIAKTPRAGFVKTRLVPPLTPEEAAAVARASLEETLRRFPGSVSASWTLFLDGVPDPWLERLAGERGVPVAAQGEGDLGDRLARAFHALREGGHRRVILIGSDSPTLDPDQIVSAIDALLGADVVLGPASDGGYYLIGSREPADFLFEDIPWSTGDVFRETLRRAERAGRSVAMLPEWYDLDGVDDLRRAAEHAAECPALAAVIAAIEERLGSAPRRGRRESRSLSSTGSTRP